MDYEGRIDKVKAALSEQGVEALLVTNLTNVRYLTGFSGSNGQLLVTESGATFLTDPRYEARAGDLVQGAEVVIYQNRLSDQLVGRLADSSVKRLGIEAATMTLAGRDSLADRLPEDVELVATKEIVEALRRFKEPGEVELIRKAVALTDKAFNWILSRVEPGRTERDIALDLEFHMRRNGAEEAAFEPIVGSGPLSAHIHHTPSDRELEKGDLVLFDFGARVDGYCADLTRTVVLGAATDEQRTRYELVLKAQQAGIEAARPGAAGKEVDAAARDLIANAGHGARFGHGLGHGVGLEVHEAPRLATVSEDVLQPGDVVTIEPGVYDVGGPGGIRIEDCVVITDSGCEVLGAAPKQDLIEI